jgi:hypothetical protein
MTDITSAASAMGKKGGQSKSIAKQRASRANLARANAAKRTSRYSAICKAVGATPEWNVEKSRMTEAELREVCEKYAPARHVIAVPAPSNRRPPKPQPATVPDEMAQEMTSDDFTL